uniref:PGG domain-containing protein n=1 Tax=Fagus sylvatica TaxID=28930 RepID=A0A2N9E6V1_FAGSY
MDQRLFEAIAINDKNKFINLVRENERILEQRTDGSKSTVLHLASRFGHIELVVEILKLCPMVAEENIKLETPLHDACRRGHTEVLKLLLENDPWAACKLNADNQSAFFMACSHGHVDLVKLLLNQSWLVGLVDDGLDPTCLHVAASRGHTGVVQELLNVFPDLAWKVDENGYSPLHHASMKAKTAIFEVFEQMAPLSFHHLTRQGETVFHLTVKYKHYDAFVWLVGAFHNTDLFHHPDQFGNTLLHLAVSRGCSQIVEFLIDKTTVEINSQNYEGVTALGILDQAGSIDKFPHIKAMLERAGGINITTLRSKEVERTTPLNISEDSLRQIRLDNVSRLPITNEFGDPRNKRNSEVNSPHHQIEETNKTQDDNTTKPEPKKTTSSLMNLQQHKLISRRRKVELSKIYNDRRSRQHEIYREALQNARNTIILVAILIATVTFTAGINPPGGVCQQGPSIGNSTVAGTTAFKVFTISNNLALFTSLCIVIVLVSIIPFQRKLLMRLLIVTHKVMWLAVSFMATAYVAATWLILPHGVVLARHWLRKLKWRKDKGKKKGIVVPNEGKIQSQSAKPDVKLQIQSHSSNSDAEDENRSQSNSSTNSNLSSSRGLGYHAY